MDYQLDSQPQSSEFKSRWTQSQCDLMREQKDAYFLAKVAYKVAIAVFIQMFFKIAQIIASYLGNFC